MYIPPKIISRASGELLIQEGGINVDINRETIDGKDSYYALAGVMFQHQHKNQKIEFVQIARQNQKSLIITNISLLNMLYYKKKTKKTESSQFLRAK